MSTSEYDRSKEFEARAEERPGEGIGTFGPIHLAACCGAAVLAVLAVILIDWLT
jgi:hypothetical protein